MLGGEVGVYLVCPEGIENIHSSGVPSMVCVSIMAPAKILLDARQVFLESGLGQVRFLSSSVSDWPLEISLVVQVF